MKYELIEHTDTRLFQDAVIDYLMRAEVECCAQIGIIARMSKDGYVPVSAGELARPILWIVQHGDDIELVAIQTVRSKMLVTRGSTGAMEFLAQSLVKRRWDGESLIGVTPDVDSLVKAYAKVSWRSACLKVRLRVFQIEKVTWPAQSPGQMRICQAADRQILARFIAGFESDIGERSDEDPLAFADRLIAEQRIFVWADPEPVAMAAWAGPTPNGVRVNFVYTAPEFRNRGYASNLVARLTDHLLSQGRKYCFLFTDQSNPTSNGIYQRLGYRPLSDSERWQFSAWQREKLNNRRY